MTGVLVLTFYLLRQGVLFSTVYPRLSGLQAFKNFPISVFHLAVRMLGLQACASASSCVYFLEL